MANFLDAFPHRFCYQYIAGYNATPNLHVFVGHVTSVISRPYYFLLSGVPCSSLGNKIISSQRNVHIIKIFMQGTTKKAF